MLNRTRRGSVLLGLTAMTTLVLAAPASADHGPTHTTFELTGGGLSISQPNTAALSSAVTGASSLQGTLGDLTVTDRRGLNLGTYTASVVGTAFTTGTGTANETIAASNVSYAAPLSIGGDGTAVRAPGVPGAIDTTRTAMTATGTVGNNTSVWNPTITVSLPASAVAGTYTGTVTHSVA